MTDLKQITTGYTISQHPEPVGYWMLHPQGSNGVRFYMNHKPSRLHIWFTEQLLGWKWRDA